MRKLQQMTRIERGSPAVAAGSGVAGEMSWGTRLIGMIGRRRLSGWIGAHQESEDLDKTPGHHPDRKTFPPRILPGRRRYSVAPRSLAP